MQYNENFLLELFKKMLLIRNFEEKVYELAKKGVVKGSVHLCIGEEATAVGTVSALNKSDYILPTHRGHGQALTKGADPKRFLAEIIGKEAGLCKGRAGSMHTFDKDNNNMGAQGILGAQFPISIGVGLAIQLKKLNSVVLCFFGDGTSNQGTFYESLNFADIWNLPIIFVCVNNLYGMGTHYSKTSNVSIHKKASIFNFLTETADGNDVEDVYYKTKDLVSKVKNNKRPALIECYTYRWMGHSAFDNRQYRPKEEIDKWKKLDPIKRLQKKMLENNIEVKKIEYIKDEVKNIIDEAEKFALESNYPIFDVSMET